MFDSAGNLIPSPCSDTINDVLSHVLPLLAVPPVTAFSRSVSAFLTPQRLSSASCLPCSFNDGHSSRSRSSPSGLHMLHFILRDSILSLTLIKLKISAVFSTPSKPPSEEYLYWKSPCPLPIFSPLLPPLLCTPDWMGPIGSSIKWSRHPFLK